ncbi:GIY-YIG nuclease family protein [uncultured Cetobacterium sp.]|uniref:GIY-YIG nuclease family protein n=1 Tax=uncultured Cetobacterium sp. TaxID=527638 RepID=UPI00261C0609|nr:GIY-YIG nuclease family protein [uncultured Cetobacterium sp.]
MEKVKKKWFVYILRCEDNSLYTGITTDLTKRFEAHISGRGAKYTRAKKPIRIEFFSTFDSKSLALKEEIRIKKLTKIKKELLCQSYQLSPF